MKILPIILLCSFSNFTDAQPVSLNEQSLKMEIIRTKRHTLELQRSPLYIKANMIRKELANINIEQEKLGITPQKEPRTIRLENDLAKLEAEITKISEEFEKLRIEERDLYKSKSEEVKDPRTQRLEREKKMRDDRMKKEAAGRKTSPIGGR